MNNEAADLHVVAYLHNRCVSAGRNDYITESKQSYYCGEVLISGEP